MPIGSCASGVAVSEELEAYLRRTCGTRVSVKAASFGNLGVFPEDPPSEEDRRPREYRA